MTYHESSLNPIQPLEIEDNFTRACNYIREAAAQGSELAVLPECANPPGASALC